MLVLLTVLYPSKELQSENQDDYRVNFVDGWTHTDWKKLLDAPYSKLRRRLSTCAAMFLGAVASLARNPVSKLAGQSVCQQSHFQMFHYASRSSI